jgi:hypothetical protein
MIFVDLCGTTGRYLSPRLSSLWLYFAEAIGATIYGLPFDQFAIVVDRSSRRPFAFRDLTDSYKRLSLRNALGSNEFVKRALRKLKRLILSH